MRLPCEWPPEKDDDDDDQKMKSSKNHGGTIIVKGFRRNTFMCLETKDGSSFALGDLEGRIDRR